MDEYGEWQNLHSPNPRRRHKNSKSKGYGGLTDLQKAIQRLTQRTRTTPPRLFDLARARRQSLRKRPIPRHRPRPRAPLQSRTVESQEKSQKQSRRRVG